MALKLYLVACNFLQSGDYRSLKERLRTLDAKQVLDNQSALRSTYAASELKEIFRQLMDGRQRAKAIDRHPASRVAALLSAV
jgi:hypothetical protein